MVKEISWRRDDKNVSIASYRESTSVHLPELDATRTVPAGPAGPAGKRLSHLSSYFEATFSQLISVSRLPSLGACVPVGWYVNDAPTVGCVAVITGAST